MKVLSIIDDSIVDGEGLRTVIFFAGCPHRCVGCHNPESWSIENGEERSLSEVMKRVAANPLNDVTFSGGEPFLQAEEAAKLAAEVKALGKGVWVYTGYTLEELRKSTNSFVHRLLLLTDVLVDGPFIEAEKDLTLSYRGSRNQRVIEVNKKMVAESKKEAVL
ncbi:anaerobic ribonucleoside-triphosphate reductase activating protein [Texcoconibacillus texcoconensis]|uniref:Anaerobic ribonucleoside-triphosphate reductase-activating protein n=1 Tax=Texcoconibacillus texcoconensis TaxID=1095777 RepID=A0A840QTU6_9BACI|nr:anaerobic ribonucleoside-triphosphate reductase activating protein [Texcoconibacillus texcoconensis]MBB5174687.1 anaerobic ribonucleoside-triphosphate reductase activating protein [Texcoconibacillus texcoconensis]